MSTLTLKTLLLPVALLVAQGAAAQSTPTDAPMPTPVAESQSPDNTGNNRAGLPGAEPNADRQKNDTTDLNLTQRIRRSLMADKTLSMAAHNVKIVSDAGQVTLKGVVQSEAEKISIGEKAMAVAGQTRVVNDLRFDTK